jgi:hypothetical protein
VKEAAAAKKATLIGTFSMLRGSWAVRAKGQLEEVGGVQKKDNTAGYDSLRQRPGMVDSPAPSP